MEGPGDDDENDPWTVKEMEPVEHATNTLDYVYGIWMALLTLVLGLFTETRRREHKLLEEMREQNTSFLKEFREEVRTDILALWEKKTDAALFSHVSTETKEDLKEIRDSLRRIESRSHGHRKEDDPK